MTPKFNLLGLSDPDPGHTFKKAKTEGDWGARELSISESWLVPAHHRILI